MIVGGLVGWSTTVKTRPDEPLWRDGTGLVLPAIVTVDVIVVVRVSGSSSA